MTASSSSCHVGCHLFHLIHLGPAGEVYFLWLIRRIVFVRFGLKIVFDLRLTHTHHIQETWEVGRRHEPDIWPCETFVFFVNCDCHQFFPNSTGIPHCKTWPKGTRQHMARPSLQWYPLEEFQVFVPSKMIELNQGQSTCQTGCGAPTATRLEGSTVEGLLGLSNVGEQKGFLMVYPCLPTIKITLAVICVATLLCLRFLAPRSSRPLVGCQICRLGA